MRLASLLLAALIVAGGALVAGPLSFGAATTPIKACAHKKSGALRFVAKGRCRRTERAVAWNRPGSRGPTGGAGPQGAPGPAGSAGAGGVGGAQGSPGSDGPRGTFQFDDFQGMACDDGAPGTIALTYDSKGTVTFEC